MTKTNKLQSTKFKLAQYFLQLDIGSSVLSISKMSSEYDVGRGTIQKAISIFESTNAIVLKKNERSTTTLLNKDVKLLLQFSDLKYINGVMPMPYTITYESLASSLYNYYSSNYDVSFFMSFTRSSRDRIEMVRSDIVSFAVVSLKYAKELVSRDSSFAIAYHLEKNSYIGSHGIVSISDYTTKNKVIVGVDYSSDDHSFLVQKYFDDDKFIFLDINYNQLVSKLINEEIDVTIVNLDQSLPNNYNVVKIEDDVDLNVATIVCRSDNDIFLNISPNDNGLKSLNGYQRKVINGDILPNY